MFQAMLQRARKPAWCSCVQPLPAVGLQPVQPLVADVVVAASSYSASVCIVIAPACIRARPCECGAGVYDRSCCTSLAHAGTPEQRGTTMGVWLQDAETLDVVAIKLP